MYHYSHLEVIWKNYYFDLRLFILWLNQFHLLVVGEGDLLTGGDLYAVSLLALNLVIKNLKACLFKNRKFKINKSRILVSVEYDDFLAFSFI